jgi:ribosomal protein S18 acetylase RimI-like enzyme
MKIITICGSLKFIEEMKYYAEKLELEGNCVLTVIYPTKDKEKYTPEEIHFLQMAHYKKIDISDKIFVVNKNGYIGEAVKAEIEYANLKHKEIIYMENNNIGKEITEIEYGYDFNEIFEVFEDIVYYPTKDNIENILLEYNQDNEKTLYGYFLNKKLVGLIGIQNNTENIEVLHFGIHPEYRGKKLGTELMDFIKMKNKTIILSTDDDAIIFYKKYGFKYTEYFSEKYQKIRYDCIFTQ